MKISALTKCENDGQIRWFLSCETGTPIYQHSSLRLIFIGNGSLRPGPKEYSPTLGQTLVHGADNEIELLLPPRLQIPNDRGINQKNVSTPKKGRKSSKINPVIKLGTFIISGMVWRQINVQKASKISCEDISLRNLRNMMHYAG